MTKYLALFLSFFLPKTLQAMKVLILIIACDTEPRYTELQKLWKLYMHSDPEHIESYFIRADPTLPVHCTIKGDVVWSRTKERAIPGILLKTIFSLEYFLPRLREFDFVIRTNLSSFYIFPRLLEFLETLPKRRCYAGPLARLNGDGVASGCGIILSPDVVELLLRQKQHLLASKERNYDDILLWEVLSRYKISHISSPLTCLMTEEDWKLFKENIPPHTFHCRTGSNSEHVYATLVNMFYPSF